MNKIYNNYQTKTIVGILVLSAVLLSVSAITTFASTLPTITVTQGATKNTATVTATNGTLAVNDIVVVYIDTKKRYCCMATTPSPAENSDSSNNSIDRHSDILSTNGGGNEIKTDRNRNTKQ